MAARRTWGLNTDILNTIYYGAVEHLPLYCVTALQDVLDKREAREKSQIQPGFILHITRAYRTKCTDAALTRYLTFVFNGEIKCQTD